MLNDHVSFIHWNDKPRHHPPSTVGLFDNWHLYLVIFVAIYFRFSSSSLYADLGSSLLSFLKSCLGLGRKALSLLFSLFNRPLVSATDVADNEPRLVDSLQSDGHFGSVQVDPALLACFKRKSTCAVMFNLPAFNFSILPASAFDYERFKPSGMDLSSLTYTNESHLETIQTVEGARIAFVASLLQNHSAKQHWPVYDHLQALQIPVDMHFWIDNSFLSFLNFSQFKSVLSFPQHNLLRADYDFLESSRNAGNMVRPDDPSFLARNENYDPETEPGLYNPTESVSYRTIRIHEEVFQPVANPRGTYQSTSDPKRKFQISENLYMAQSVQGWIYGSGVDVPVAIVDTGVDFMHPLLWQNYRGYNVKDKSWSHHWNWKSVRDRVPNLYVPIDPDGHGTAATSIIAGNSDRYRDPKGGRIRLSVAPAAKWIAASCQAANDNPEAAAIYDAQPKAASSATLSCYKDALTWAMMPMDLFGERPEPTKAAKIIYFPFSLGKHSNALHDTFQSLRKSGRIAIVPIGAPSHSVYLDRGSRQGHCGSIQSPAEYDNVITVGSADIKSRATYFTSAGPSQSQGQTGFTHVKPDVVAYGLNFNVARSYYTSYQQKYTSYGYPADGSSFSAALVAGLGAAVIGRFPFMTLGYFRNALRSAAVRSSCEQFVYMDGKEICGPKSNPFRTCCGHDACGIWPNYYYGWGLIRVGDAFEKVNDYDSRKIMKQYDEDQFDQVWHMDF